MTSEVYVDRELTFGRCIGRAVRDRFLRPARPSLLTFLRSLRL